MKVVDISAWQEYIDWQALKDYGIQGVIIKLGENYRLDEMFIEHVNNAVKYGFQYGIYYYSHASSINEGITEANWIDKKLKNTYAVKIRRWVFGWMQKIMICY